MSLCSNRVTLPAGVDHDSGSGFLQMKSKPTENKFVIVALGKTFRIKEELKGHGFQWSQAQQVWYWESSLSLKDSELRMAFWADIFGRNVHFRCLDTSGDEWTKAS